MIASQVDAKYTNDDSIVVSVVTAQIAAQFSEETDGELYGAIAVHNELGGNKSVLLPLYRASDANILTINNIGSKFALEDRSKDTPDWFKVACAESSAGSIKAIKTTMQSVIANMGIDTPINREVQLNILVPKRADFTKSQPSEAIKSLSYEVLSGEPGTDLATYRRVYDAIDFYDNGHLLEAILSCTLMPAWQTKNLDMPYSICREVRWLGAQYLSKNTRGNLFPQLMPMIDDFFKKQQDTQMMSMNDSWGALGFLSSVKKG